MTPHHRIIAFTGRKGAGKSTASAILLAEIEALGRPACVLSVAAPLKEACVFILDLLAPANATSEPPFDNAEYLHNPACKELHIPGLHNLTGRRLAQSVGEAVKAAAGGRNLWAEAVAREAAEFFGEHIGRPAVILVDDLRFPEECAALARIAPVYVFRLEGGATGDAHPSETAFGSIDSEFLHPVFDEPGAAWLNPVRRSLKMVSA